jgi:hypothetical protein
MNNIWMKRNIECIGKTVVFYVPSSKINEDIRKKIHDFFVSKHNAYTHECGEIVGYWSHDDCVIEDKHERFEISLEESDLSSLVDFLEDIGKKTREKSIYLTVGDKAYLINIQDN